MKLSGKVTARDVQFSEACLFTLTRDCTIPMVLRPQYGLLVGPDAQVPKGFGAYLSFDEDLRADESNVFILPPDFHYLSEGGIVRLEPGGRLISLFRKDASYNTILLTEQCNHYCLMCSQPPKKIDDSWLLGQAINLLELIPKNTNIIGFSGGEPTLYKDDFVRLMKKTKSMLPHTKVDVLSNGRYFSAPSFARKVAAVDHPQLMFCIPLYSDDPVTHDYVVQSVGAYDETLDGILNLKALGQKVEIRIVIHRQTIDRLEETCEFIARNLVFVDHVALMGLEITGFTRANLEKLWIDPFKYKDQLSRAVAILNRARIPTSVYNHQLCTINDDVLGNYQRSISSWKNEYIEKCDKCDRRAECGGFFSSSKKYRHSDYINPFLR